MTLLDRLFPPEQCDERCGDRYVRGDTRWWALGPQHVHRSDLPLWPVMDDEGEVA